MFLFHISVVVFFSLSFPCSLKSVTYLQVRTKNILVICFLACIVAEEKLTFILLFVALYVMCLSFFICMLLRFSFYWWLSVIWPRCVWVWFYLFLFCLGSFSFSDLCIHSSHQSCNIFSTIFKNVFSNYRHINYLILLHRLQILCLFSPCASFWTAFLLRLQVC